MIDDSDIARLRPDPVSAAAHMRRLTSTQARSVRRDIRNPVLALPAIRALQLMPSETRDALATVLMDLATDASARADHAWSRHKAPMAAYWKAVAVYARHTARSVRAPRQTDQ